MPSPSGSPEKSFKPGWRQSAAFTSLAIVNLACALDATSIAVALPVSSLTSFSVFPSSLVSDGMTENI